MAARPWQFSAHAAVEPFVFHPSHSQTDRAPVSSTQLPRRARAGLALLALLLVTGCSAHVPPPEVGSIWWPGKSPSAGTAYDEDAVWRIVATKWPTASWGGEGIFGYCLIRQDPETDRVLSVVDLGTKANRRIGNMVLAYGSIWMGCTKSSVIRVDTKTLELTKIKATGSSWWRGNEHIPQVTAAEGAIWVLVWGRPDLYRIDPDTGKVRTVKLNTGFGPPQVMEVREGEILVTHTNGFTRVDPD